jgi:hypothetical protein
LLKDEAKRAENLVRAWKQARDDMLSGQVRNSFESFSQRGMIVFLVLSIRIVMCLTHSSRQRGRFMDKTFYDFTNFTNLNKFAYEKTKTKMKNHTNNSILVFFLLNKTAKQIFDFNVQHCRFISTRRK